MCPRSPVWFVRRCTEEVAWAPRMVGAHALPETRTLSAHQLLTLSSQSPRVPVCRGLDLCKKVHLIQFRVWSPGCHSSLMSLKLLSFHLAEYNKECVLTQRRIVSVAYPRPETPREAGVYTYLLPRGCSLGPAPLLSPVPTDSPANALCSLPRSS